MSPETLTFACPVCNSRLTVPIALAGVIGPCPTCQTRIQAPALPAGYGIPPVTAPAPAPQPPAQTAPPAPAPTPVPVEIPVTLPVLQPVAAVEPKPVYKPEPRQLPNRPEGMEPIGKRMSDSMKAAQPDAGEPRRGSGVIRLMVPVLFLMLAAGLVFGILTFLNHQNVQPEVKSLVQPGALGSMDKAVVTPSADLPPAPAEPDESAPVAPPAPEALAPPDPSSAPAAKPTSSVSASQILEKFLAMKTLADRRPLMETTTVPAELEASCLAASLPPPVRMVPTIQTTNAIENSTDYYFKVTFNRPVGGTESYDMLVRRRGDQDPKVVVDSFLDLYGENSRLRRFARVAVEKPAIFQVYVEPARRCFDPKVPNYDKKFTVKISGEQGGGTILNAYSGNASAIGEMIEKEQMLWGRSMACTIILSWNTKDDPAHPYIEANMIKALTWNP
ncbi:hypothetical protein [Luteolibacter sp. LG18]|uniref:hypothetical protein n=1 Tax=Luteolibacter sp. LG18 TaxID=2819286 RepID=UPI002B2943CC|nr:hypothetical protein llg_38270 [Luteolibacter sp. LG18]